MQRHRDRNDAPGLLVVGNTIRSMAEERGSRTHQGLLATLAEFEVRPFHQEAKLFQYQRHNLLAFVATGMSCGCFRRANYTIILLMPHCSLAHEMAVLDPSRITDPIEKFENLHSQLAACTNAIPEWRNGCFIAQLA